MSQEVLPVAPYFPEELEEAGDRVDRVLRVFSDGVDRTVEGVVRGRTTDSASASSLFFFSFETDIDDTWNDRGGDGSIDYSNFGRTGGRTLRTTGEVYRAFPASIPFDESRLYRVRGRVRRVSGDPTGAAMKIGFELLDGDGTLLTPAWAGLQDFDLGSVTEGTWFTFATYVRGYGTFTAPSGAPDNPASITEDARYFRPAIWADVGGDLVVDVDFVAVELIPDRPEVDDLLQKVGDRDKGDVSDTIKAGSGVAENMVDQMAIQNLAVGTAQIQEAAITTARIDDLAVSRGKIANLAVNNAKIENLAVDKLLAGSLAVGRFISSPNYSAGTAGWIIHADGNAEFNNILLRGGLIRHSANRYMDLDATGSQPFLKFDGIELRADGTRSWTDDVLNPPALTSAEAGGVWNGSGTGYTVIWNKNSLVNTTDHRIAIDYYRGGSQVGQDTGLSINASPRSKTISGGSSGQKVYAVVYLTTTTGAAIQSIQTVEMVQIL